jgi:hypothetical protein
MAHPAPTSLGLLRPFDALDAEWALCADATAAHTSSPTGPDSSRHWPPPRGSTT